MKTRFLLGIVLALALSACSSSKWPAGDATSNKPRQAATQPDAKQPASPKAQSAVGAGQVSPQATPSPVPLAGTDRNPSVPPSREVLAPQAPLTPPQARPAEIGNANGQPRPGQPAEPFAAMPNTTNPVTPIQQPQPAVLNPKSRRTVEEALQAVAGAKQEVSVSMASPDDPVLSIRYPWQEFPRPSLQIAWTGSDAELAPLQPLVLDGQEVQRVWQIQVDRLDDPVFPGAPEKVKSSLEFIEPKGRHPITLRAHLNKLGKESAHAIDESAGNLAVFYLLDGWADDSGTLRIALSDLDQAAKFAMPGKVRVWFFSQEKPIWNETVDWPGGKAAAAVAGTPAVAPPGSAPPQAATAPVSPTPSPNAAPTSPGPASAPTASTSPILTPAGVSTPTTSNHTPFTQSLTPPAMSLTSGSAAVPWTTQPPTTQADARIPQNTTAPEAGKADTPNAAPVQTSPPAHPAPTGPADLQQMNVGDLIDYIEAQYKPVMAPQVRKFWVYGVHDYRHGKNPITIRRGTFMDMLRDAYDQKPPKDLQQAFRVLFFKLDAEQKAARR